MATDISICNSALVLIGADENAISTFEDATRPARVCSQLYPTTRGSMLSRHPWNFTLGQVQLAQIVDDPLFQYNHAYQLPTDPKMVRLIRTDTPGDDYRIFEDKLYTNFSVVNILYQFDPGEENYPDYFVRVLELRMAELLALALSQDESFSQVMAAKAFNAIKEARYIDSTNIPPQSMDDNVLALTSVR